jgi:hypothetical protein
LPLMSSTFVVKVFASLGFSIFTSGRTECGLLHQFQESDSHNY